MRISAIFSRFVATLTKRPATSFVVLLILLFGTIALGSFLRTPETDPATNKAEAKETALFDLATDTAFVAVPAKVKKESIINIVALAPGVVSTILTSPGRTVVTGQTLLILTNDYGSGSVALQKSLASESARLTAELAKIDKDISALEEKKTKNDDSLSNTEEDLALAELKKDRATRKSTLEQSALSTKLANVSDAVLKPKVFTNGTIQSIRVKRGDLVTTGQILATLSTPRGATTLEAFLDPKTVRLFDPTREALLTVGNETLSLLPTYFSQSENENGLFSVLFTLSEERAKKITNGEYLSISLPLRHQSDTIALVPIDAIFQDESTASLLLERDGIAVSQIVTLGNLYGSYAEILSGLTEADRVILSRSVIAGDQISVQ
ncbi:MAG: biotin/lipoyl-binding protein [Candidatus Moranbacteria bacterium]|nr:biotin/lipoyl-binding protein [Candidatus Moranbacteria bacterium]